MISLQNISLTYGDKKIFAGISWLITAGSRIGLVGDNGAGKTTLFKVIKGETSLDDGMIEIARNRGIGYLPQEALFESTNALYDEMLLAYASLFALQVRLRAAEERLAAAGDDTIMVIDSRTPDWVDKGTIPGSVNIPWDKLNAAKSDPFTIAEILENQLGARNQEGLWDFSGAKTLVMFCNGMWCGQSPTNIRTLLKFGYPANKLKWYRGGMQDWEILGLTTVVPKKP